MARQRVAVIGSGFGGSVMACRLAESGEFDVQVFERGPRYGRGEFPRGPSELAEKLFWDPEDGRFGMFEYRSFDRSDIDVVNASGVGGGSLIYSNVLYRMPDQLFHGWPGGLNREVLEPYYRLALGMLDGEPYPFRDRSSPYHATPKSDALAVAEAKIRSSARGGPAMRLEWPHLAVQFGRPGESVTNAEGFRQTNCTMCGECTIGCNYRAKNTLDLNYLARAERFGASVRAWSEVRRIHRDGKGFRVEFGDPRRNQRVPEHFDRVIVAAGSLGSTRLLLRLRADVPAMSRAIGTRWSPNGDLLGFISDAAGQMKPDRGPVITGALYLDAGSYPDGSPSAAWIEDGGLPPPLALYILGVQRKGWLRLGWAQLAAVVNIARGWFGRRTETNLGRDLSRLLIKDADGLERVLPLLAMGRDRADGTLRLAGRTSRGRDRLHLRWRARRSKLHYQRVRDGMRRVADALGGAFTENPTSSFLRQNITVHPVGGCPLGDTADTGAVDARSGEAFGCEGLYVIDGSIIPTAVGPNPALTIAALAELYATRMLA